ncbi:MAG: radical SAM protein [Deltaproteobacteria bacterium]|nr:radical SAM protein [Deltaproteobacteria bacterium]
MLRARHLKLAARVARHAWRELHPFEVQAAVLNNCNLKCAYCRCPESPVALMTTAQWTATIAQLGALGTLRIKFQGGEPTLRPDFRQLCAAARAAGILAAVVTNGQRIAADPTLLDELDEAVFSLDSTRPEANDRLRGAGVHANVVRALDLARARGVRAYVNMVVTRDTLPDVAAMLEFCEARGVGLHVQPVVFGREYYDDTARAHALSHAEMQALHAQLAAWARAGRGLMFSAESYAQVTRWPDYDQLTRASDGPSRCMAGKFYVHIEPNGDVHPCAVYGSATFEAKNLLRDGLLAALRHVRRHDCGDCFAAYLNERKALFGLRPAALLGVARRG